MERDPESREFAKLEYSAALDQYRQLMSLRRQDMAFVTTVQAAVLTIVGNNLLQLDVSGYLLSLIAAFVLFLGFNSERRLSVYIAGYMQRAKAIEAEFGMELFTLGGTLHNKKLLLSNAVTFPLYYCFFLVMWLIVWLLNLFQ